MKVLHLAPGFPPEPRGGVEHYVEALCPALARHGVACAIAAGSEETVEGAVGTATLERVGGLAVHRLRRARGDDYRVDVSHPSLADPLERVLDRERPDVAHVHHWLKLGLGLVPRLAARGIPTVVTLHDVWTTCTRFFRVVDGAFCAARAGPETCGPCLAPLHGGPIDVLRRELRAREALLERELSAAARLLVPSVALKRFLERELVGLERAEVVPNGLLAPLARVAYRPPEPGEPLRVGTWGGVVQEKGVHVLLEAASRLAEHRAVELHVLGHLPDAGYARALRAADRAGVLRLHGAFDPPALPAIAATLHVAVFASICFETYSLVLDEALALGLPVIASDRGALPERVGAAGEVVEAGSADALERALRALAEDPARLARLAAAARPVRGVDAIARDLAAVYRAVARAV